MASVREPAARVLFDLGDNAALHVPRLRLIFEFLLEALDLGQHGPPHGALKPMHDLLAQALAGGQARNSRDSNASATSKLVTPSPL